jgi:mono/diheme cytochrome c family protein
MKASNDAHANPTDPIPVGRSMNTLKPCLRGAIAITVLAILATVANGAGEDTPAAQWNILAVPAGQAAFSGQAAEQFNQHCASCHSKDGRAQTPVARQRHVKDLSESRLPDAEIIEQILRGSHEKTVPFKMPPFKEKLARSDIASLVPLVKAFRPPPPGPSDRHPADAPRLAGIINFGYDPFAVLEAAGSSGRYFILRENESREGVTLLKIHLKKGRVKLQVNETNPPVSLSLDNWISRPRTAGWAGLLDPLGEALAAAPHKVVLSRASTELVLFLYSQFAGRTLLCSPHLPAASFDLNVLANGPEGAAHGLNRALNARGIAAIEDGDKFLLVVPRTEAKAIRPLSSKNKSFAGGNTHPDLFPGGAIINLPNADLEQVVKLYADLTGHELDHSQPLPLSTGTVNFTTRTALNKEECLHALDTLLHWQDLEVVPAGNDAFKVERKRAAPNASVP